MNLEKSLLNLARLRVQPTGCKTCEQTTHTEAKT